MNRRNAGLLALGALVIFGCGGAGSGTDQNGQVSGIVTDPNGNVVRNAKVYYDKKTDVFTFTNSSGAFILGKAPEGFRRIVAEVTVSGTKYSGENDLDIFGNERSKNLNITMSRESEQGTLTGRVFDRNGFPLENARVFVNTNNLGSRQSLTDDNGTFVAGRLTPNVNLEVYATGATYDSDRTTVVLTRGERRTVNFTLENGRNPNIPAPANLTAVAWTSPRVGTTGRNANNNGLPAMRRFFGKQVGAKKPNLIEVGDPKLTSGGNWIEVDLSWDTVRDDSLLGYGIYRATSSGGTSRGIEFLRDPLTTFFADADDQLTQDTNYYYEVTSINTQYPDTNQSESNFSNRYGVRTLGDMRLSIPTTGPLTFRWQTAPGATQYTTFVYDRFPDFGADPLFPRPGNSAELNQATVTGTSYVYNGPALVSGRTYYYIVLGSANSFDSRTISVVSSFRAP
jgi:hypothetical protein